MTTSKRSECSAERLRTKVKLKLRNTTQSTPVKLSTTPLVKPLHPSPVLHLDGCRQLPAPIPSVCVQLVEGDDNLIESARKIRIRLYFSAWDPGTHGPDLFHKKNDGSGGYIQWYNDEAMAYFRKSGDGWMDAWNFVDTAIRKIENSEYLSSLRVTKENGIKFGPLSEQDSVPDFYPYWFAWVEFSVEETMTRKPDYNQFL